MKRTLLVLTSILTMVSCKEKNQNSEVTSSNSSLNNTIYHGGDILTMEGDTPLYAEAVVQKDGKIVFVGSKEEALKHYKGNAEEVDLEGKTMLPAFLDSHGHFFNVGFFSLCANLLPPPDGPGKNIQELVDTLNEYKETEEGKYLINKMGWIIGSGYDDSQLEEKNHPKATDLDKISTEYPVIITHQSGHIGVTNTKGLQLLNLTKDSKDPDGGA